MKRILALVCVFTMLLCGCSKEEKKTVSVGESIVQGDPAYGGEISLYSFQQDTFNPLLTNIKANYDVLGLIFEPIVKVNSDGKTEGILATSWTKSEDGKTYTLEVRDGVLFHNGDSLTAHDVATSIMVAISENSPFSSGINGVENATVINGKVVVSLAYAVPDFEKLLEIPVVKSGDANKTGDFPCIGTGPYVYSGSEKNKTYTLSVNENWWQGKAYISKINIEILPDKAAVAYSYDAANIDAFSTDVITAGKYKGDKQSRVTYYTEDNLVFLGFNNLSLAFSSPEARKTVAMAIDKDKINEKAVFSNYVVADTPVNPQKYIYNKSSENSETPEVKPADIAPFEVLVCTSSVVNSRIGEELVKDLKGDGFNVTLVSITEEEYINRISTGQYDAFVGTFSITANSNLAPLLGEGNYFNYNSEAMNWHIDSLTNATTDEKIKAVYADMQKCYSDDMPFVSLFFEKKALVVRNTIGGKITPLQNFVYSGVDGWYTKTN